MEQRGDEEAFEAFRHPPGSLDASAAASVVPAQPDGPIGKATQGLWNQPIQRQLLFLPALVAFIWWKWLGFSGWWWLVALVVIPSTVLYRRAVRRATEEVEPHELPPLPAKYRDDGS